MSRYGVMVWIAWAVLSLGSFGVIEYAGLRDPDDQMPPLTQVLKRFVPRWLTALVLGGFVFWAYDHFTP